MVINVYRFQNVKHLFFFCQILNFLDLFSKEYLNNKFYKHASSGSRVVLCRRTDGTMLIVACRNFANTPIKPLKQLAMNAGFVVLSIRGKLGIQQYFNTCADANMSLRSPDCTGAEERTRTVCD
jgi:hypothetical protein